MNATSDILIIGGGVIGLAIAVELKLRGASVTVLSRDFQSAATRAAAGMLAPQAEQIPASPMLDLCLQSRSLYPEWTRKIEAISGEPTGYWPCGILAPVYEHGSEGRIATDAHWLDQEAIHSYQPGLSLDVVGGWWYPQDGQVDNRTLLQALQTAARSLGVEVQEGITVEAIEQQQRRVVGVQTSAGVSRAEHYILATGAWSNELLSLPVRPKKGQMLSVKVPKLEHSELLLQRVLYAPGAYIVPRRDGRIVIGATSEEVGFTPHNTPAGVQGLWERAIHLYPQLQRYPIEESWWGFRPATPDELPILGSSPCQNLTFATGHYRNGILLAPVTAILIAQLIFEQSDPLLNHFHYSRFFDHQGQEYADPPAPSVSLPLTQNANY